MEKRGICIVCSSKMYKTFDRRNFEYFQCPGCRHVTTFPYPTASEIKKHYQQGFKEGNYRVVREHTEAYSSAMNKIGSLIENFFSEHSRSISASSILDVGCFTGEFLYGMSQRGAETYGVELQEEAAKIAEKRLGGRIYNEDILDENFSLHNNEFDIITLLGIIEHVTDPVYLLKRVSKLLKPSGLLVIQIPNSASLFSRIMGRYWPAYIPVEHIHIFSSQSLLTVLNAVGFRNIVFKRHWKTLPISYIYGMFKTFSPVVYRLLRPLYTILPRGIKDICLPFYLGETIVFANFK